MKGLTVAAAVVLATFGIAACGGSDSDSGGNSDEDQVTVVVSDFQSTIADDDYAAACEMFAPDMDEFFNEVGGCETVIESSFGSLPDEAVDGIEPASFDIQGDTATVGLENGDELYLKKQDGEWVLNFE